MGSGDTLTILTPSHNVPPGSNYATFDTRNNHLILDFDDGTDENAIFPAIMPLVYGGGGIEVTLTWMTTSDTTGNVVWQASIEAHVPLSDDLDSDSFAAAKSATTAAPGTSGQVTETTITFTDGAEMDSLAAGESFRIRVTRDANNASDTITGDAELVRVHIKEV